MRKKIFGQRQKRDQLGWISVFLKRKKRSSPQESSQDSCLIRRNKAKNLHLCFSEIMRKLKHLFKKEKPQHDKILLGKKKRFQRSLSTKDHFFLERMTSISHKKSSPQEHQGNVKHLSSEMLNLGDSDQTRIVSFPEYLSLFSSPGRIWDQNSTLLSRSASDDFIKSETIADGDITIKEIESSPSVSKSNHIVDEISKVEAYDAEKEAEIFKEISHEESLPQLSFLSVASPSHFISKTEEDKLVLEPLFLEYEISPARGEAKRQPFCKQLQKSHSMDEKESVFDYVKAVLDAIDTNWEELYLKTEFSDQLLNPALISNIPFYPNQLSIDHELLFDCINEVLFEFCRFPQWVSFVKPRTQVFSFSVESIAYDVQKEVYCRLFPLRFTHSLDQIVREDMAKPRNWLDIRCDFECIGFETSELILNELLEELMLDL